MLKILAILVGGPLTILALMSIIGAIVENGWVRLIGAVVLAIGVPAIFADRVLPDDPDKGKGLVTDVIAIFWLGFAFLYIGLLAPVSRGLMHQEAGRLWDADKKWLANGTYWLAGGKPDVATTPGTSVAVATDAGSRDAGAFEAVADDAGPAAAQDAGPSDAVDAGANQTPGKALAPEEIFKTFAPAVVSIQVSATNRGGSGTGFIIDAKKGIVVTNSHVVDSATNVRVKLKDDRWARKVELLVQDKDNDLALLRISPAKKLAVVNLGDSDTVKVGERAISIGNPLGLEHTLTDGLVSARRVISGQRMIQMSTPISPGNSGGPLFNARGEVIGVSTATLSGFGRSQNLNLAVPINTMKELLKDKYPDAKKVGGGGGPDRGTW